MIGTWMQQLAISWLTYKLTQSPFMLGAIAFACMGPTILFGPFAGVIPDLFNRHKLLITTQSLLMLQSVLLTFITLQGHVQVWQLIALGAFAGMVNAVDMPTRQAFVVDMSERKEDLSNVIALNSSLMNFTRLIGPALAGIVVATWGEGTCFMLNSISFVAVIIALMAMRIKPQNNRHEGVKVLEHLRQGFTYVGSSMPIKFLLFTTALTSLIVVPYMVLMPVYAKTIFHGNAQTLGYMMGATSLGSLIGTLMLASRKSVLGLGRWLITSLLLLAASLLIFAFSHNMLLSFVALIIGGFGMTTQMASSNTMLQTIVDDDKRGRVMSLYTMAFLGVSPIGGLLDGYLAVHIGCIAIACGSGVLAIALAVNAGFRMPKLRQHARPIYIERGIIPPVVESVQS